MTPQRDLHPIDPKSLASRMRSGSVVVIDIRDASEFAREHIEGALSVPLSTLEAGGLTIESHETAVFHCKSGMRTQANCGKLAAHIDGDAFVLEGGLDAWKAAGLSTTLDRTQPIEIGRQVQITAGLLVVLGAGLGAVVSPLFHGLSAFIGAGLVFAGVSGWCGMATLLRAMPWNRQQAHRVA
ncbi:DUF2892 domain-containing protein [bacterium]|nr:DUF2892 domain-containing protein [bacterium]